MFINTESTVSGRLPRRWLLRGGLLFVMLVGLAASIFAGSSSPNPLNSTDPSGTLSTYSTAGGVDQSNAFFQNLGTNGRTCGTCHVARDAWTVIPPDIQARFNTSSGLDPIFRLVDGSNCPNADVSTFQARQAAYSLLLNKGLIRISIAVPDTAQIQDENAGNLTAFGATGGPVNLSKQPFYIGINDSLGGDPSGSAFNPNAFTLTTSGRL